MAIVAGQLSATTNPVLSTTVPAALVLVPAGVSTVVVSNVSGATVLVGATAPGANAPTNAVLQVDGFPIPSGAPPVAVPGLPTSRATQLWIVGATSGTLTGGVGFLVSTAN